MLSTTKVQKDRSFLTAGVCLHCSGKMCKSVFIDRGGRGGQPSVVVYRVTDCPHQRVSKIQLNQSSLVNLHISSCFSSNAFIAKYRCNKKKSNLVLDQESLSLTFFTGCIYLTLLSGFNWPIGQSGNAGQPYGMGLWLFVGLF